MDEPPIRSPAPTAPKNVGFQALPLVSIVTPSYNQGRYLEQTILSVLGQTYPQIEYLVIDGGSRDNSGEIIRKYANRLGYWHSQPDRGCADAIHQGFARAHGEILAWLNSDDLLAPDAVEHAVAALQKHPAAVLVYGNRICIDQNGEWLYSRPSLPWLSRSPYLSMILAQESCFWRRTIYDQVGGCDPKWQFAYDYDLFSKFAQAGSLQYAGRIWGFFRKHPETKTMLNYSTVGIQEGRMIQQALWGGAIPAFRWRTLQNVQRLYAICASAFLAKPTWPNCLPPPRKRGLLRRIHGSLHETSRLKQVLGRFLA